MFLLIAVVIKKKLTSGNETEISWKLEINKPKFNPTEDKTDHYDRYLHRHLSTRKLKEEDDKKMKPKNDQLQLTWK